MEGTHHLFHFLAIGMHSLFFSWCFDIRSSGDVIYMLTSVRRAKKNKNKERGVREEKVCPERRDHAEMTLFGKAARKAVTQTQERCMCGNALSGKRFLNASGGLGFDFDRGL